MTLFIAHRTDGLGGRLLNMMVTMLLAEIYGGDFRFTWRPSLREHHALDLAELMFEPDFLAAHLVQEADLKKLKQDSVTIDPDSAFDDVSIRSRLASNPRAVIVSRLDAPQTLAERFEGHHSEAMKTAFERIGFTPEIRQAIVAAHEQTLPKRPVAIHLRAGDIIFGSYRLDPGFEEKIVPLPLAYSVIDECSAKGQSPIIFGQDIQACQKLADMKGCQTAERIIDSNVMTPTQRAMFEMVLLSRMECIHAGMSLFAFVPAAIGSVEISDPLSRLSPKEIVETTLANLPVFERDEDFSRLQIAYCYRSALYFGKHISTPTQLSLVDGAIRNDPTNSLYRFMKARILCEAGHYDQADAALMEAFYAETGPLQERSAFQFLFRRDSRDHLRSEEILLALGKGPGQKLPYICLALSIASMRLYDLPKALAFLRNATSRKPNETLFKQQAGYLAKSLASPAEWIRWIKARLSFHRAPHYLFNKLNAKQRTESIIRPS